MIVKQLYTSCLAEAAYFIESNGEAVIIDPLRETAPYLKLAEEQDSKIKYILETHFHADFVSGHIDLAKAADATIVFGPNATTEYDAHIAEDGEVLKVGDVTITVLHTPGHTMESTTFLLKDEAGKDYAIFTGDTLFIGDVGRPDLAVKTDLTREDLASHLYDSLRNKIMPLADEVIVYPGHGAGSACGKKMSKETQSTIGQQKATNYALRADMDKDEFVKEVTDGLAKPPQYFPKNVVMNKKGYSSIDEVIERGAVALSPDAFEAKMKEGTLVIDTRHAREFNEGFVPGSLSFGLNGQYAVWIGALIEDLNQPILIVAEEGTATEAVIRLARVGYDNSVGYLKGGVEAWKAAGKEVAEFPAISAEQLAARYAENENLNILDVRKESEYSSEHLLTATNFPLDTIWGNLDNLDKDATYYVHCAGGYRSMIASSILTKEGFNVIDVEGGFEALAETSLAKSEYVCPSTLL